MAIYMKIRLFCFITYLEGQFDASYELLFLITQWKILSKQRNVIKVLSFSKKSRKVQNLGRRDGIENFAFLWAVE